MVWNSPRTEFEVVLSQMANPTQPGIEVVSKEFKRDDNDTVLCTDRVEVKVKLGMRTERRLLLFHHLQFLILDFLHSRVCTRVLYFQHRMRQCEDMLLCLRYKCRLLCAACVSDPTAAGTPPSIGMVHSPFRLAI